MRRHSVRLTCQSRTVLSIDEDMRKLFLLQLKSRTAEPCAVYSLTSFVWKTGALSTTPSFCTSSAVSCRVFSRRSSWVEMTDHTRTILSCPAAAKYLPSRENSIAHMALVFPCADVAAEMLRLLRRPSLDRLRLRSPSLRICARKIRSKSFCGVFCARTLMYFGGAGNRGIYPIGWEKTSAFVPVGRFSESSDKSSGNSEIESFFLVPMIRLKKETPFLWYVC